MIVVDTNIIASMTFPTQYSAGVSSLHEKNSIWEAPIRWKTEFVNVLSFFYRKGLIDYKEGLDALDFAERLIGSREHQVAPKAVLDTTLHSTCSAYDAELIVLARHLNTALITYNETLLKQFPDFALTPEDYVKG